MILLKLHHIHRNKNMLLLEFICQLVACAKFTPFVLLIHFDFRFSSLDLNISLSEKLTNLNCFKWDLKKIWQMCLVSTFPATPPFSVSRNKYDVINQIVGTHPKSNILFKKSYSSKLQKKSFNDCIIRRWTNNSQTLELIKTFTRNYFWDRN